VAVPMRSTNFKSVVEPILNEVVDSVFIQRTEEWKQVFKEKPGIKRSYHEFPVLYGMGAAPEIPDGTAITYQSGGVIFIQRVVYKVYGLAFALTRVLVEDGDHIRIGSIYSEHLAQSYIETEEVLCANIINRAYNAAFTGGDGVALGATNHPIIGGTYSNILTTPAALSQTSLEQMLVQIRNAVDYNGKRIRLTPLKIVTGPSNVFQAEVLLKSVLRANTANNDVNPILSLKMLSEGQANLSRLTSTTQWGIQTDCAGKSPGFVMMTRRRQSKRMEGDFETDSMKYACDGRYQPSFVEPRCYYSTPGL
jgi:hypothetical protein